jgi:hypothetical protein
MKGIEGNFITGVIHSYIFGWSLKNKIETFFKMRGHFPSNGLGTSSTEQWTLHRWQHGHFANAAVLECPIEIFHSSCFFCFFW